VLGDVGNAIQHRSARKTAEQAKLHEQAFHFSHRLNTLAALFFPLTANASIFGMNLAHGLNQQRPAIFWLVFVLGCGLGFAMKSWVLGKPKPPNSPDKNTRK